MVTKKKKDSCSSKCHECGSKMKKYYSQWQCQKQTCAQRWVEKKDKNCETILEKIYPKKENVPKSWWKEYLFT